MDGRPARREKERSRYRQEILACALDLFSEKGYHNVCMHEIAEKSEFAIGTLYKFFRNKEDLYKALMMEKAKEFHSIIIEVISRDDDILTIIKNYIATKASLFASNISILRLYFAETQGASFNIKAGLDQDIRKLHGDTLENLASALEKGIRAKVLRDVDPYHLAVALEGLTSTFLFCWMEDPDRYPYEANISLIAELFLKGSLAE